MIWFWQVQNHIIEQCFLVVELIHGLQAYMGYWFCSLDKKFQCYFSERLSLLYLQQDHRCKWVPPGGHVRCPLEDTSSKIWQGHKGSIHRLDFHRTGLFIAPQASDCRELWDGTAGRTPSKKQKSWETRTSYNLSLQSWQFNPDHFESKRRNY